MEPIVHHVRNLDMKWRGPDQTVLGLLISILMVLPAASQELNELDAQGRRHGLWKGYYDQDSTQLKFEGNFEHGKEVGEFKFYQPGFENPVAIKTFEPTSDTAEVRFLTQEGNIVSVGKMLGKDRIGTWKYFHKGSDAVMTVESYQNGKLEGEKRTYYDTGKLAESAHYKNGKLHGERILYSEEGVVLEHLNYLNGELHGPAKFYNGKGELKSEGQYQHDRHHGVWKYYESGKLKEKKKYP